MISAIRALVNGGSQINLTVINIIMLRPS